MVDCWHLIGGDLQVGATGDLRTVDGVDRGTQRVLRRLLTNAGDYIWAVPYGAGLPRRVGEVLDVPLVNSLIRSQIFLEESVARLPEPIITVAATLNGVFVKIAYADAATGEQRTLSFEVN